MYYWYKIEIPEKSEGIKMELTPRERDVLTLVAEGYVDKQVARQLKISPRTIQTHLNSAILKLKARNRIHAVALFVKAKYTRRKI